MKIVISGAGKRRSKELIEAANFFADILLGPKLSKNIKLRIVVKNHLGVLGECEALDRTRSPREFQITLLKRNEHIISTLAHELVHVKQFARNELGKMWEVETFFGPSCVAKWQGSDWSAKQREDDYYDSPWEIEAYGREVGLYHRWEEYKNR